MWKNKFRDFSLQKKITVIYILANIFIFLANFVFILGINSMSNRMEQVYKGNMNLNMLSDRLNAVQSAMTGYLNGRTSEGLENYYRCEHAYEEMIRDLSSEVYDVTFLRMERDIKCMSEQYLEVTNQTIEAKRGRNVEKYRIRYEDATKRYQYIDTYIRSLNMEQFVSNSEDYNKLSVLFRNFEYTSMFLMVFVLLGSVFVIVKVTGNLIRPLQNLSELANEVAGGNFEIELADIESKDEIGIVNNAFNQMVISIRRYIQQLRESMENERKLKENELLIETHLKDAKLKYLIAQINPHFLFNTLNAGAQLAMMEGADRTYEYVQQVALFYRYNVKKGNDIVTIKDEMELIDNYIYILNVRFSGDIHYEKEVDEKLLGVQMPNMVLQPIVENCINHGIREKDGDGKIWFEIYEEEERVCISIRDNGIGMETEVISQVLNGTYGETERPDSSNGIGMDNVIARLRLFNGFEKVMDIFSEGIGFGTEVIIYLKKFREEEKDV